MPAHMCNTYTHVHAHVHTDVKTHVYTYAHMHVYAHVCTHVCTHVHTHHDGEAARCVGVLRDFDVVRRAQVAAGLNPKNRDAYKKKSARKFKKRNWGDKR